MTTSAEPAKAEEKPSRPINKLVVAVGAAILLVLAAAVIAIFFFVGHERQRALQEWQIRLGIVADSRTAAVNDWIEQNYTQLRELTENTSLKLYMTEVAQGQAQGGALPPDAAAQLQYLRNLLIATAERTGFKAPPPVGEVAANVERVGIAGLGVVDAGGTPIASTPAMPPPSARTRTAVAQALDGKPALIDVFVGASNQPTIGFVLPIFALQDTGSKGIGAVVGIRLLDNDFFERLKQPGATEKTAETYIVRKEGGTVQYLSPLADGTPPLKRALTLDTPDLADAWAIEKPGGFAIKRDYAGADSLLVSRPIVGAPWVLIRKVSRTEALAATDTRLMTFLGAAVGFIVIITIALVAVWRHGSSVRATEAAEKFRIMAERFENMTKFMRLVTNSQPTIIVAVDGDTRYTFANEPAAREAGIPAADMIGKTMAQVIGPVKAQAFAEINKDVLKNFEREQHMHFFEVEGGNEDEGDLQVIKSDHIPLRADRDYPPGVLMILEDITELTRERRRSERMLKELINTLVSVVDRRDPFSAHHSARVAEVVRCIAKEMGADDIEIKTVEIAGSLMNLGKIFIPAEILTKTTELTPEERSLLANSYMVTVDLLEGVTFEGPVVETIRQMGERWDGSGPLGLREEEILRTARMLAVANAFVGMVSARAFRAAMTFEKTSRILMEETGTKFDRKPVTALINFLENRGGTERWAHFRNKPIGLG
jgi:PAS domain S-box-containing protein